MQLGVQAEPRSSHRPRRAGQPQDRYERLSPHPRRRPTNHARLEQLEQQYRNFRGHSSSDECLASLARNKSKSTSSIDTQSVNNILDEFEELDCRRSSDLSDIELGCVELSNFQEMMDYQRRLLSSQRQQRQPSSPASKVSRQTQVQQRSRDAKNPSAKPPPELLLRKGEVQRRVDEWLSQTRSQNCAGFSTREGRVGLTRSNSSAEAKSQRRLRQQESRSRRSQLNGSSSYDDLTCEGLKAKVSVGVNTSRASYKQYLALRSRARLQRQQQQRSREASPAAPAAPRASLSFRCSASNRQEPVPTETEQPAARSSKNARARHQMENRISSLIKARNEVTRRSSVKRESARSRSSRDAEPPTPATESSSDLSQELCGSVSARVRAFQGRSEQRLPKSRSLQGSSVLIETRNKSPMSPSRSDGFQPKEHDRGQSTFKPNAEPDSPARRVEKIYETTLQPEVIHADDLESVFRPGRTNFVYGEPCGREASRDEEPRPQESGLNTCLKLLQRSPSFRLKRSAPTPPSLDPSLEQSVALASCQSATDDAKHERSDKSDANSYESRSTLKLNLKSGSTSSSVNNEPAYSSIREKAPSEHGALVSEVLVKNLQFKQDLPPAPPAPPPRACPADPAKSRQDKPLNYNSVLSDDYEKVQARSHQQRQLDGGKIYVTKEEMERKKLMDLLRKGQFELAKLELQPGDTIGCLQSSGTRGVGCGGGGGFDLANDVVNDVASSGGGGPSMCCVLQGAERVFPSPGAPPRPGQLALGAKEQQHDLPLESLWAAGLDEGMGFPQRCSYANQRSANAVGNHAAASSPEDVWLERGPKRRQQQQQQARDEIWTLAGERIGSLESLDAWPERLDYVTRQPRANHDWVRTERIARFAKHRTIGQSPRRELAPELWASRLDEATRTATPAAGHRCRHQTRRSFSTSIVAELAVTPDGSQQSIGSADFLELERSYTLSTPGGGSPACCPPCSPPPAPAAYISSARASSRRLGASGSSSLGNSHNGPGSPERDPLARLLRHLKSFYRELGTRDPAHLPQWAAPLPGGTLCPAHFQPHLQIVHKSEQEHRLENIRMEQIFAPVRLGDGSLAEAPRRVSVEGGPGSGRTTLCLRLLYQWATQPSEAGPLLALIVPLRELRGGGLLGFLARELFPRGGPLAEALQQVWRTLQLLEDRLLFVLDGYDECARASLGEAADLLEGRLFPEARLLLTCSANDAAAVAPLVQRRLHLAGLEWPHVERLCVAYFIHNDLAERACEFLEVLNVQPLAVRQLAQHPLGWLMLCALYQDRGQLPAEMSALVQAAVKCVVRRSLEPAVPRDEEIPAHCRKRLEDFGRLALAALREGRTCYPEAELRTRGGGLEVARLGFLSRGPSLGQRRRAELYTPIHLGVAEFLAAYYLSSVAQYANILRRELEGLPPGILGHLAGLLGPRSHLVLNQLCPLEVPARGAFSLLRAAGASEGNVAAVCRLLGAGPGFGPAASERPPAPLVHTAPLELEGWARILASPACSLEALEVVFQVERGSDPSHLDEFFGALARNESVKLVRITSLLGHEFPADEVLRLAGHVRSVLGKRRLHEFELVVTCLEESAHDRLECVVSALCRGMSQASSQLSRLVLDMNLSGAQVSRVCDSLRHCQQVQALHLPHLGCGCEGLASVAELLKERPLLALNLAGSWGAKNEDPSSSGISMGSGSGSGSSGCASSTLGSLPASSRCYSSLPRGALAAYGGSNRPATLPRLPLGLGLPGAAARSSSSSSGNNGSLPSERDSSNGSSKRNSDSVLCHRLPTLHPQPACDVASHQGTGFHEIFTAIREPNCKLRSLNVSKCLLGGLDACCLAETIRRARNLDAVRAAGASRPGDVMPLVLALAEAPCLQLLDLASPRLALDDHPCRLLCHALARNSTLRLLSLEGWTFRIEESETLSVFSELLRCTSVRELSLCNARLHLAVHEGPLSRLGRRDDAGAELLRAAAPPACPDVLFLRLAGFQVTVNDRLALRGPLLLPFLAGFTGLSELDLSLDKSTIGGGVGGVGGSGGGGSGSGGSLLFIDDRVLLQFFGCLGSSFRGLQSLRMNFWRVSLDEAEKTLRQVGKQLRNCLSLSFLKASGLVVTDSSKKTRQEHGLIQAFVGNLHSLAWLCLDGVELTESQATAIGKCLRERFAGPSLEISAKDVQVKAVKALVASVEEAGKAEVLYAGGATCRLKITKLHKSTKPCRKK